MKYFCLETFVLLEGKEFLVTGSEGQLVTYSVDENGDPLSQGFEPVGEQKRLLLEMEHETAERIAKEMAECRTPTLDLSKYRYKEV